MWEPFCVEHQLTSLGKTSSCFYHRGPEESVLFVHETSLTLVLAFSTDNNRVVVHHVREIESESPVRCISGNSNSVLMLDIEGNVFSLKGAKGKNVEHFNPSDCMMLLTSEVVLVWQRICQLTNCLALAGLKDLFAFLCHDESLYCALYKPDLSCDGLLEYSKKILNFGEIGEKCLLIRLSGSIAKIVNDNILKILDSEDEALLIIEPTQIMFSKPTPQGQTFSQPFLVDFHSDSIVSVIDCNKKGAILVVCRSGKIACLKFNNSARTFLLSHFWLPKKVFSITGYEDGGLTLFWSDLNNLYVSKISEADEITHLEVTHNIRGIRHFIKADNNIIAITKNCCFYETEIGLNMGQEAATLNSSQLLNGIFETGKEMEKLNEEIREKENLIEALEISKIPDISERLRAIIRRDCITLQNRTKYVLKKEVWKLQFEMSDRQRKKLEIRKLDNDINPDNDFSFQWNEKKMFDLNVTLFCDKLPQGLIFIPLSAESEENLPGSSNDSLTEFNEYLKSTFDFIA